jgi:hypothetical protein
MYVCGFAHLFCTPTPPTQSSPFNPPSPNSNGFYLPFMEDFEVEQQDLL